LLLRWIKSGGYRWIRDHLVGLDEKQSLRNKTSVSPRELRRQTSAPSIIVNNVALGRMQVKHRWDDAFLTSGHSDAQDWASECPDVKNYKWRLYPVWHRMLRPNIAVPIWQQWASKG